MTYPKSPTDEAEALEYAATMAEIHGKPWIAIKRIMPINSKITFNFTAIEPHELDE